MRVIVTAGDDVLHRFGNQIAAVGEGKATMALARAVNRVTKTVEGRVIRALVKQTSAPRAIVRAQIRTQLADPKGRGAIEGRVIATGRELSLSVFRPKQFSFGVRVKVWGKSQRYEHAFIYAGHWRSGQAIAGSNVFKRTGAEPKPIEKLYGPSIPREMVKDHVADVFQQTVADMLPRRVAHELGRLLPID